MADRTVVVRLVANNLQYDQAMRQSAVATGTLDRASQRTMATTGKLGGGLDRLSKGLIAGYGLKQAFDATAGAAIGWESAFTGVRKTVEGTPEQMARIADGLRQMSKEIPTSAEDLAAIAESAGQLGIETDNVLDFTRVIADLGETTNLAGQEGATQLARFANITQMSQQDFDRLGSTVVALGNNFETTEAEIVSMGLRLAGAGAQVGLTESEILGLATALSSVGIEAEAGGSAISRVMIEIASQVATTGDNLESFAAVAGMSAEQFQTAWGEDAVGALVAFIEGLAGMEAQGGSTLQTLEELGITEIRMRDALLRLAGNAGGVAEAVELGNDAWRDNIALQREAELRYGTTESKIALLGNKLKDLGRDVGEEVLPDLISLLETLTAIADFEIEVKAPGGTFDFGVKDVVGGLYGFITNPGSLADAHLRRVEERQEEEERADLRQRQVRHAQELLAAEKQLSVGTTRLTNETLSSAEASAKIARSWDDAQAEADALAETVGKLSERYGWLVGVNADAVSANLDFRDSLVDLADELGDGSLTLDEYTEEGRGNQRAILDVTEAIGREIEALEAQGATTQEINGVLRSHVDELVDVMEQAGYTSDEIEEYLDLLGLVPDDIVTRIHVELTKGDLANIARLEGLARLYGSGGGSNVPPEYSRVGSGASPGGGIEARAGGGPFDPNSWYLVGEEGPELLYTGAASGTVVPNHMLPPLGANQTAGPGPAAGAQLTVKISGEPRRDTIEDGMVLGRRLVETLS